MERFINILVIHPEEIIQIGLKEILSGGGNNVLMAGSNEDALTIIGKKEVGIIILDIDALKIDKKKIPLPLLYTITKYEVLTINIHQFTYK